MAERTCIRDDCSRIVYARALCRKHYCEVVLPGYWVAYNRREDVKARKREWTRARRLADPEREARRKHDTYVRRKAKHAAERRAWVQAHPERMRELSREHHGRRKARKRGGSVTSTDFAAILAEHGMVCHICGGAIASRDDLHFDHVIPLARGGEHAPQNIRPAHATCNMRKHTRILT